MEVVNRYVATRHHIEGAPTEADFEVKEETVRWAPDSGEVLVRNLYLSIDPYQLNRMKRSSASHLAVDSILPGQVDLLKDKLGFDDAFNYKEEPDLKSALKRYFPDGIDVYFENVGGEMLEAALANMNTYGRVALSGVIAEYTGGGRRAVPDLLDVIYKRITIQGFFAWDFLPKFAEFNAIIAGWIREGKVKVVEDVSDGLESVPSAFAALFRGQNVGKKLVKLA